MIFSADGGDEVLFAGAVNAAMLEVEGQYRRNM